MKCKGWTYLPKYRVSCNIQTEGLLNIRDEHKSSGIGHIEAGIDGILRGLANPLGSGLGSTTMAAGKFGSVGGSTEIDISDAFESMGIVGGFIYIVIVLSVLTGIIREWRRARSPTTLAVLAVLLVMFGTLDVWRPICNGRALLVLHWIRRSSDPAIANSPSDWPLKLFPRWRSPSPPGSGQDRSYSMRIAWLGPVGEDGGADSLGALLLRGALEGGACRS